VEKTHKKLARLNQEPELTPAEIEYQIGASLAYNRQIGNSYTASLYLGIISLLENVSENLADRYLGLYSYGSGCVAEFFSAKPVANYQKFLAKDYHQRLLNSRVALSFQEYLDFTNFKLPQDGSRLLLPKFETGSFRFSEIHHHQRMYERCS
jgi:hydroxymethylglutaryl-CoA synthase